MKGLIDPSVRRCHFHQSDIGSRCSFALLQKVIEISPFSSKIRETTYSAGLRDVLPHLTDAMGHIRPNQTNEISISRNTNSETLDQELNHDTLWPRVAAWLIEGGKHTSRQTESSLKGCADVVILDTGTQVIGLNDHPLPKAAHCISQIPRWQSIGYGNGAVLGAALALSEESPNYRTILFAGDGGLQTVRRIMIDIARS